MTQPSIGSVVTVGNSSWVKLDVLAGRNDLVALVLNAKKDFEDNHPDLKVTGWHLYTNGSWVNGLWIDHESRASAKLPAEKPR